MARSFALTLYAAVSRSTAARCTRSSRLKLSNTGIEIDAVSASGERWNLNGNCALLDRIDAACASVKTYRLLQLADDRPTAVRMESCARQPASWPITPPRAWFTRYSASVYWYELPPQPVLRLSVGVYAARATLMFSAAARSRERSARIAGFCRLANWSSESSANAGGFTGKSVVSCTSLGCVTPSCWNSR